VALDSESRSATAANVDVSWSSVCCLHIMWRSSWSGAQAPSPSTTRKPLSLCRRITE